jgi:hypothetical protein
MLQYISVAACTQCAAQWQPALDSQFWKASSGKHDPPWDLHPSQHRRTTRIAFEEAHASHCARHSAISDKLSAMVSLANLVMLSSRSLMLTGCSSFPESRRTPLKTGRDTAVSLGPLQRRRLLQVKAEGTHDGNSAPEFYLSDYVEAKGAVRGVVV